jgi:hypothetical protein
MAKGKKKKNLLAEVKLSKEARNKIERRARREAENRDVYNTGSKIHKSKKKYKREKYRYEG